MSSLPPEEANSRETGAASAGPGTRWPRWRISMLVGALILLAAAIVDAAVDDLPRQIYVVAFFAGYVLLAYGFFLAMSARRGGTKKKG